MWWQKLARYFSSKLQDSKLQAMLTNLTTSLELEIQGHEQKNEPDFSNDLGNIHNGSTSQLEDLFLPDSNGDEFDDIFGRVNEADPHEELKELTGLEAGAALPEDQTHSVSPVEIQQVQLNAESGEAASPELQNFLADPEPINSNRISQAFYTEPPSVVELSQGLEGLGIAEEQESKNEESKIAHEVASTVEPEDRPKQDSSGLENLTEGAIHENIQEPEIEEKSNLENPSVKSLRDENALEGIVKTFSKESESSGKSSSLAIDEEIIEQLNTPADKLIVEHVVPKSNLNDIFGDDEDFVIDSGEAFNVPVTEEVVHEKNEEAIIETKSAIKHIFKQADKETTTASDSAMENIFSQADDSDEEDFGEIIGSQDQSKTDGPAVTTNSVDLESKFSFFDDDDDEDEDEEVEEEKAPSVPPAHEKPANKYAPAKRPHVYTPSAPNAKAPTTQKPQFINNLAPSLPKPAASSSKKPANFFEELPINIPSKKPKAARLMNQHPANLFSPASQFSPQPPIAPKAPGNAPFGLPTQLAPPPNYGPPKSYGPPQTFGPGNYGPAANAPLQGSQAYNPASNYTPNGLATPPNALRQVSPLVNKASLPAQNKYSPSATKYAPQASQNKYSLPPGQPQSQRPYNPTAQQPVNAGFPPPQNGTIGSPNQRFGPVSNFQPPLPPANPASNPGYQPSPTNGLRGPGQYAPPSLGTRKFSSSSTGSTGKKSYTPKSNYASGPGFADNLSPKAHQPIPMAAVATPRQPIEYYFGIQIPLLKFSSTGEIVIIRQSQGQYGGGGISVETRAIQTVLKDDSGVQSYPMDKKKGVLEKWLKQRIDNTGSVTGDSGTCELIFKIFNDILDSDLQPETYFKQVSLTILNHFGIRLGAATADVNPMSVLSSTNLNLDVGYLGDIFSSIHNNSTVDFGINQKDWALSLLFAGLFNKDRFLEVCKNYVESTYKNRNSSSYLLYVFLRSFINAGEFLANITPQEKLILDENWFSVLAMILNSANATNTKIVQSILIQYAKYFQNLGGEAGGVINNSYKAMINYMLALIPIDSFKSIFISNHILIYVIIDIYLYILDRMNISYNYDKKVLKDNLNNYLGDYGIGKSGLERNKLSGSGWFGSSSKIDLSYQFNKFIAGEDTAKENRQESIFDKVKPNVGSGMLVNTQLNNQLVNNLTSPIQSPFTPTGGATNRSVRGTLNGALGHGKSTAPSFGPLSDNLASPNGKLGMTRTFSSSSIPTSGYKPPPTVNVGGQVTKSTGQLPQAFPKKVDPTYSLINATLQDEHLPNRTAKPAAKPRKYLKYAPGNSGTHAAAPSSGPSLNGLSNEPVGALTLPTSQPSTNDSNDFSGGALANAPVEFSKPSAPLVGISKSAPPVGVSKSSPLIGSPPLSLSGVKRGPPKAKKTSATDLPDELQMPLPTGRRTKKRGAKTSRYSPLPSDILLVEPVKEKPVFHVEPEPQVLQPEQPEISVNEFQQVKQPEQPEISVNEFQQVKQPEQPEISVNEFQQIERPEPVPQINAPEVTETEQPAAQLSLLTEPTHIQGTEPQVNLPTENNHIKVTEPPTIVADDIVEEPVLINKYAPHSSHAQSNYTPSAYVPETNFEPVNEVVSANKKLSKYAPDSEVLAPKSKASNKYSHSRSSSLKSNKFSSGLANVTGVSSNDVSELNDEPSFGAFEPGYSAFEPVTHQDIEDSLNRHKDPGYAGSVLSASDYNASYSRPKDNTSRFAPMDQPPSLANRLRKNSSFSSIGTASHIATYVQDDTIYEDEDENDISEDEEEVQMEKRKIRPVKPAARPAKREKKVKQDSGKLLSRKSSGWFNWLSGNEDDANAPKVHKAKLGTENNFYYDEKLKRWIDKNKPLEEQEIKPVAPPPKSFKPSPLSAPPSNFNEPATKQFDTASLAGAPPVRNLSTTPSSSNISVSSAPTPSIGYPGAKAKVDVLDDIYGGGPPVGRRKTKKSGKRGYVNVMDTLKN